MHTRPFAFALVAACAVPAAAPGQTAYVILDLGTLGGTLSSGFAINNAGQVAGESTTAGGATHAFRTAPNAAINPATDDLGTLGGTNSSANAINTAGLVVGQSDIAGGGAHAFVYDTQIRDLNTLIPAGSGWVLEGARGVNDVGQITGYGIIGGQTHGFVLTPVPEPAAVLTACLGGFAIIGAARRLRRLAAATDSRSGSD